VRILVVDDDAALRQNLVQTLALQPDLEVVGEAADGISAVRLAEELQPELILMDIVLPRLNGIDATRQIRQALPNILIIGLSAYSSTGYAARMLEAGACAYVLKHGGVEELLHAIRTVCKGRTYVSPSIDTLDA
jgi:DNA-binding NarL/FixJ family response regulator